MLRLAISAVLLALSTPSFAQFTPLSLICTGSGTATKEETGTAWTSGEYGGTTVVTTDTQVGFSDQVRVEITSPTEARMMLPRTMLPPIRGGKDGWFEIEKLQVSDSEIRGSVPINPFSSPKMRIDRITGLLKIDGKAGTFAAECEPFDPATAKRKF